MSMPTRGFIDLFLKQQVTLLLLYIELNSKSDTARDCRSINCFE
jgi:hypothetical protein